MSSELYDGRHAECKRGHDGDRLADGGNGADGAPRSSIKGSPPRRTIAEVAASLSDDDLFAGHAGGMVPRPYQIGAVTATIEHITNGGRAPLNGLATGTGKAYIIAIFCRAFANAGLRVACTVHTRELVQQNYDELRKIAPDIAAGMLCAGWKRYEIGHAVTMASVQTLHARIAKIPPPDVLLIDECHGVSITGQTRHNAVTEHFRQFVPEMPVIGLTATPYRMGEGRLDEGPDAPFDKTVFTYAIHDGVRDGYLNRLLKNMGLDAA